MRTQLSRLRGAGLILAAALSALPAGCKTSSSSSVKDVATGPTTVRPSWLLSPEQIESTVRDTWGLSVSDDEAQRYFGSGHTLIGGTSVVRRTTLLTKPHELYVLTMDSLSAWVADKLTAKQMTQEKSTGKADQFAFRGFSVNGLNVSDKIHDPAACKACYDDDSKAWCDCADGIVIGGLKAAGLTPAGLAATSTGAGAKAWRKRLMHNMQDIGDFLMCGVGSIDDQTLLTVNGAQVNIAQYLLDEVFLPGWTREVNAGTDPDNSERKAWANVIHTILVGQGCFMNLAAVEH